MDFYEVLDQVIDLLRRRGRVSYRALKRQFDVDDDFLADLKEEIIDAQRVAVEEDGRILVWTGPTDGTSAVSSASSAPEPASTSPAPAAVTPDVQAAQAAFPPLAPPPPEAERRQLTVMFADLVDSTQLSGQLDPEDYREVLRAYQQTCAEVIQQFDGYIAQHLGDALLVYFGFPVAHEDEGQRAVRTGLGMLGAMRTLNDRLEQDKGIRLAMRVGIHTGLTVVGDIGAGQKHELLALGEAPNIASRIQGLAEPHTIAISEATYRLVEGYFTVEDLGFHALKGVAEPQQIYRVLQASGARSRLDIVAPRGLTPLVGREQEVGLLLERWTQAKDGQGQVALLSGEGGIGKSRLVQVLKDHVAGESPTRLECRSSPYYQHTAWYPLIDLLERSAGLQRDDTPAVKLEKLEQLLHPYRLPLAESVPLFASLLAVPVPEERYPPRHLSPQRQRQQTLEAMLAMMLELSEHQPVLFILEDVHWTDPSTLELLDLLIDHTPASAVLTVLTCRPTFQPQPAWASRSYVTQITLTRLSHEHIGRMAVQVAGGKSLPSDVLQQLVAKTDGVPLFVEEMTKALLESGHLHATDDQYALTGALPALAIPPTLHDSLMARLDRLVTAKAVAQYAAVIGRQFSYELLQTVSQVDEATLQRELGRLVEAELLHQRGLLPGAMYVFKHALIQDAAYQSLLKSTRQRYHQRIAQVLEAQFPETAATQPELLAHHYTQAGCGDQAVAYWQRASQHAFRHSAHAEAIGHATYGLDLLTTLPATPERLDDEASLLFVYRQAFVATRGYAALELEASNTRVREVCQQLADTPRRHMLLSSEWSFYLIRGELHTARGLAEQLLHVAQRLQDPLRFLRAHSAMGQTLRFLGEFIAARAHLEQGVALYDPQQHRPEVIGATQDQGVTCLSFLAFTLQELGYADQAVHRMHEALSLARHLDHPYSLTSALIWATFLYRRLRQAAVAQEYAEAAMALASEQGFRFWLTMSTFHRGWALATQGQDMEGIAQMRQGLTAFRSSGAKAGEPSYLALLAEAYGNVGQVDDGMQALTDALALMGKNAARDCAAELYRLRGELLLKQSTGHQDEAAACFRQALEVARHQHAKASELRAVTSLARLWQRQGKPQDASDLLAPVYGWFTEGFDTPDLQEAKALLDDLGG